ncbi:MAG: DUF1059 domain-containing protein [Crocinitomicaceae bacterium]
MKKMTCKQLGGACDLTFEANTFEEIAEMSKNHGTDMFQKNDPPHLEAMQKMQSIMRSPNSMQEWFEGKRKEFNALPDIN